MVNMAEKEYEEELTRNYELGVGSGIVQAGDRLLEYALEAFKKRDDTYAMQLRMLAEEFKKVGEDKLSRHRKV